MPSLKHCAFVLLLPAALALAEPAAVLPTKLTAAEIGPGIFARPETVVTEQTSTLGEYVSRDLEAFRSRDGHFDAGIYAVEGAHRHTIDAPYGVNEFMYFLEGGVTVTSTDGTVTRVDAGEALILPEDWQGVWESEGYTKIYVIYSPDKPIE